MVLTEKETTAIEDLKTQEQACINKYNKYKDEAKDEVLLAQKIKIATAIATKSNNTMMPIPKAICPGKAEPGVWLMAWSSKRQMGERMHK